MQRKRGKLVPIGEVIADLPGPVQALKPSPRRGTTSPKPIRGLSRNGVKNYSKRARWSRNR